MSLIAELTTALDDGQEARNWLQDLASCHAELVDDCEGFDEPVYPFFEFVSLDDFALLAIFRSVASIDFVGLDIPEQQVIELSNQLAMSDVQQIEEFLESNTGKIRFRETGTLESLDVLE